MTLTFRKSKSNINFYHPESNINCYRRKKNEKKKKIELQSVLK